MAGGGWGGWAVLTLQGAPQKTALAHLRHRGRELCRSRAPSTEPMLEPTLLERVLRRG